MRENYLFICQCKKCQDEDDGTEVSSDDGKYGSDDDDEDAMDED